MIPGYRPTIKTATLATLATLLPQEGANGSKVAEVAAPYKSDTDPYSVVERAAIMEYDAEMRRPDAERAASLDTDAHRPDATLADVRAWLRLMDSWTPAGDDDLPPVPPPRDGALWDRWWAKVGE